MQGTGARVFLMREKQSCVPARLYGEFVARDVEVEESRPRDCADFRGMREAIRLPYGV